jgi:hypothetical protein
MNNIKAGADIHAGAFGYSIGTQEKYEEFEKLRNQSMNAHIKELMGRTLDEKFSHTWTTMDYGDLEKFSQHFAELIVQEVTEVVKWTPSMFPNDTIIKNIKKHFGV